MLSSFPGVETRHANCSHCLFEDTRKITGPYLKQDVNIVTVERSFKQLSRIICAILEEGILRNNSVK